MEPERLNLALNVLVVLPEIEQRIDERFAHPLPMYDPQSPSVVQYRNLHPSPHHSNIAPVADDDASYEDTSIGNPPAPAASLINPEQEANGHAVVAPSGHNEIPQRPRLSRERTLEWLGEIAHDLPVDPQLLPHDQVSSSLHGTLPRAPVQTHPAASQMNEDEHEHENENEDHENGHDHEANENNNGDDHEGGNGNHHQNNNHNDSGYEDNDENEDDQHGANQNNNEHNENGEAGEGTGEEETDYDDGLGDENTGNDETTGDDTDDADDESEEDSEEEPKLAVQQDRPAIQYMTHNRRWFLPHKEDTRLAIDRERVDDPNVNVDEEYDMSKLAESEGENDGHFIDATGLRRSRRVAQLRPAKNQTPSSVVRIIGERKTKSKRRHRDDGNEGPRQTKKIRGAPQQREQPLRRSSRLAGCQPAV